MTFLSPFRSDEMTFPPGDSSSSRAGGSSPRDTTALPARMLLWIDQVGGFLVCLRDEVTIGATNGGPEEVDIPLMANLSRRHATIHRQGETYSIAAHAPSFLGDRAIDHEAWLSSNKDLRLGGVGFRFRQPTVLSATAVLDSKTSHRIAGGAEGIVLMHELCLLGPAADHHIVCRHWNDPIILFRRKDQLRCKSPGPLFVNGELVEGDAALAHGSIVTGTDARFRVEYC